MRFEWDYNKNSTNEKKHKITFELGITIFDDPFALIIDDIKRSTPEEKREWIIETSDNGVLVIIFTKRMRGAIYRIISARKANKKERTMYEKYKRISI